MQELGVFDGSYTTNTRDVYTCTCLGSDPARYVQVYLRPQSAEIQSTGRLSGSLHEIASKSECSVWTGRIQGATGWMDRGRVFVGVVSGCLTVNSDETQGHVTKTLSEGDGAFCSGAVTLDGSADVVLVDVV